MKKYSQEWWLSLPPERVGKETEKLVEDMLKDWNKFVDFAYHRLPDSKSARNYLKAQPADFVWWKGTRGGYLEVKATAHAYRLVKDKVRQLPDLHKFALAGARSFVLVHHYLHGLWRVVPATSLEIGQPSWDLTHIPTFTSAEEALKSTGVF